MTGKTPARSAQRGEWRWAAFLVAVFAGKAAVLATLGDHPLLQPRDELDTAVYLRLASRIAEGDLLLGSEPFFLAPLYTYFLGAVLALTGGSLAAVRVVQIALGTAAVGLAGATAARWWTPASRWFAGSILALTGICTFYEITILQTALDPFLTALALWAFTRALQGPSALAFLGSGVCFGLLALNRPNALLVIAGLVAGLVILGIRGAGARRAAPILFALGVAVAIAPAAIRNHRVSGEMILVSSHGGLNFYIGNNERADGTYVSIPGVRQTIEGQIEDTRGVAEAETGRRQMSSREVSRHFFERAITWIRSEPARAARLFVRKLVLVLAGVDLYLNHSYVYFSRDERSLLSVLFVGAWFLVPFGLVGLALRLRWPGDRARFAAWALFVPLYALSVALFFVAARYRLPLYVALAVASGGFLASLRERSAIRTRRDLVLTATALAALFALTFVDFDLDDGRYIDRTEMVLHDIRNGEDARAKRLLARTAGDHPFPGVLHYRAGLAWRDRGAFPDAIAELERARALDPGQPEVALALGRTYLLAGMRSDAIEPLRLAYERRLEPERSLYALVVALASSGGTAEAVALLRGHSISEKADPATLSAIAEASLDLREPEIALRYARAAARKAPAAVAPRMVAGLASALLGRSEEAEAEFRAVVALDPKDPAGHMNLAAVLAERGRRDEAVREARRALELRAGYEQAIALLEALRARTVPQ